MIISIRTWLTHYKHAVLLIAGIIIAIAARYSVFDYRSQDYFTYTKVWYNFILNNGGFLALKTTFYNYTPAYLYLLVLDTNLLSVFKPLVAIKLLSLIFDVICAVFIYKLVRVKYPRGLAPQLAFLATLLLPTVILNSAMWGQADSIYTAALVASVYFLIISRKSRACIAWGLALAVKPQGLFLLPLMLVLFVRSDVSWKHLLLTPIIFFASLLPVVALGRPVLDIFSTLFAQANNLLGLSSNAPNFYLWLPNKEYRILYPAGLVFTVVIVALFVFWAYRRKLPIMADTIM